MLSFLWDLPRSRARKGLPRRSRKDGRESTTRARRASPTPPANRRACLASR